VATWHPHVDITHAEALIRSLRARAWTTSVVWFADDRQYGEVWICREGRLGLHVTWREPHEEATALLRCALLVAAGIMGRHHHSEEGGDVAPAPCEIE
jgi:hypothetical protein